MGTDTGLGRRAGTVARWPVGMGLAFWRYLWRTLPLHRDTDGSADQDLPPPLPRELVDGRVQLPEDGSGRCSGVATGSASKAPGSPPRS